VPSATGVKKGLEAVIELRVLGYVFTLQDGGLRYNCRGHGDLEEERVRELLIIVKECKEEILSDFSFLIEATLSEINEGWLVGTLEWVKRFHPEMMNKLWAIEEGINETVRTGDIEKLKEALKGYGKHVESMVRAFKIRNANTGNLFERCRRPSALDLDGQTTYVEDTERTTVLDRCY
jgi:hypothetical protein